MRLLDSDGTMVEASVRSIYLGSVDAHKPSDFGSSDVKDSYLGL